MDRCKCDYIQCGYYWPDNGRFVNGTGFERYTAVKVENVEPLFEIAFQIAFEYSRLKPKDWLDLRDKATQVILKIQKDTHELNKEQSKRLKPPPLKEV